MNAEKVDPWWLSGDIKKLLAKEGVETEYHDFIKNFAKINGDNTSIVTQDSEAIHIIHNSKYYHDIVENSCGKLAQNKRIPDFTWNASKNFKIGIIKGCFDGDGSIYRDKKKMQVKISR
jgi:hypothetical protein